MKFLLDTDVLLDIALDRVPFYEESRAVSDWCQARPASALVAWHTVSNLYYLLRGARSDVNARDFLVEMLRFAIVLGGGTAEVRRALTLPMRDFEDALQVAAGLSGDAEFIVTRDLAHYRVSPLPSLTPGIFLRRFARS